MNPDMTQVVARLRLAAEIPFIDSETSGEGCFVLTADLSALLSAYEEMERPELERLAALERRGWRLVHPENYTPEMMATTARHVPKPPPEMSWLSQDEWRTLLAAAPTYATPAAGKEP